MKLIATVTGLITAVTALLALYWQHNPPKAVEPSSYVASGPAANPLPYLPSPRPSTPASNPPVSGSPAPGFTPAVEPIAMPAPVAAAPALNLSGVWMEPEGNQIVIAQNGDALTISMPYLELFLGNAAHLTKFSGSLAPCDDGLHAAHIDAAAPAGMALSLFVTRGARRMEGSVSYQFATNAVILTRR